MGYQNANRAWAWAGLLTHRELCALVYMALCTLDDATRPLYFGGHDSIARNVLGRAYDTAAADAVGSTVKGLLKAGAISYRRRGGAGCVPEYYLHLNAIPLPVDNRVRNPVDQAPDPTQQGRGKTQTLGRGKTQTLGRGKTQTLGLGKTPPLEEQERKYR